MPNKKEPVSTEPKKGLSEEQAKVLQEAAKRAAERAEDWRKRTKIDPDAMRKPLVRG